MKVIHIKHQMPSAPMDKDSELEAHRKRVSAEHELAEQIEAAQEDVENRKAQLKEAKEELDRLMGNLYQVARSHVQTEIFTGGAFPAARTDEAEEEG